MPGGRTKRNIRDLVQHILSAVSRNRPPSEYKQKYKFSYDGNIKIIIIM